MMLPARLSSPAPAVVCLLSLLLLLLLACSSAPQAVQAQACTGTPLTNGETVHIAVMVFLVGEPQGLFTGRLSSTRAASSWYGIGLAQSHMLGLELYMDMFAARNNLLPLGLNTNVTLNFSVINLGNPAGHPAVHVNYTNPLYQDPSSGFPTFYASAFAAVPGSAKATGLLSAMVSTDPAVLQQWFGISQPFTFLINPMLALSNGVAEMANRIETNQTHVLMGPFNPGKEMFACENPSTLTPECPGRGRVQGARRWNTFFSVLFDSTANQLAALDQLHLLGAKSLLIIRDAMTTNSFSKWATIETQEAAAALNFNLLDTIVLVDGKCATGERAAGCPPAEPLYSLQGQVFANNETAATVGARIAGLNPDAIIILLSASAPTWTIAQLFLAWTQVGYTPKAVSWGGGQETGVRSWLPTKDDLVNEITYTWSTKPWDWRLKGKAYKNEMTENNFELLPYVAPINAPEAFQRKFDATYGPGSGHATPTGQHPWYIPPTHTVTHVIGWTALTHVQKMLEEAKTRDVPSILVAAKTVARPGAYHYSQFDVYGRTARVNEILVQTRPGALTTALLSPYNIAEEQVYPIPTWKERVFDPQWYSTANEQIVVAVTAVCIAFCLGVMGAVVAHRKAPVIRAATPSFCVVIILGAVLMLSSNFFATLVVDDAHCAASVWMLTLGFTIVFSSLFIKTFRIWRIFGDKRLAVLKMKDSDLLLALGAFMAVDVLINAAWQGSVGMRSMRVTVDPLRPSYDYLTCDYSESLGAVYAHIAIKAGLLLVGVALTWAVRHVPSQFNESTLIALAIYNVSFIICFILPIIAVGLGGRTTVFMIRAFAIIFVSLSTIALLFVPKFRFLGGGQYAAGNTTMKKGGLVGGANTQIKSGDGSEGTPASPKNGSNPNGSHRKDHRTGGGFGQAGNGTTIGTGHNNTFMQSEMGEQADGQGVSMVPPPLVSSALPPTPQVLSPTAALYSVQQQHAPLPGTIEDTPPAAAADAPEPDHDNGMHLKVQIDAAQNV